MALLVFLFWTLAPIYAIDTSETRTVNVTTAGNLSTVLPQAERQYVVNLTITGKLNGTDFNTLRTMATDQKLQVLDLSGANIVSGGASYYSNYGTDYYTKNNEFGYSLFIGCKQIQKVVLPNSLVTIGQCAFWNCTSLKTIVIGSKVTTIKPGLWGGCRQLTDVQINNNSNFHLTKGILYNKDYSTIIAALQTWNYGDLTIRSGVKEIQYDAFAFCSKLTSVSFPSSVTTIGDTAFEYTGITSVNFTSSITSIGSFVFSGCKSLKQLDLTPLKVTSLAYGLFMTSNIEIVYLPKTLKELKQSVFSKTPLKHIFAYTTTPATMYDSTTSSPTFDGVDKEICVVHVPQGRVNTYKAATGWKEFQYITDSQEIEPEQPKDISNVDDLQARLDEIAAKGLPSSQFETVELSEEGVLVDKVLYVRNGCRARLTGGPLRVSPNIGGHYCIMIGTNSFLYLGGLTVDLMNNDFHINSGIFYNRGELRIGNPVYDWDVNFINVPSSKGKYGECIFYMSKYSTFYYDNPGILRSGVSIIKADDMADLNIWEGTLESNNVPTIDGCGRVLLGATVNGYGNDISIIKAKEFWDLEGRFIINDLNKDATYITAENIYLYSNTGNNSFRGNGKNIVIEKYANIGGRVQVPQLFLNKDAYITLAEGTLSVEWKLDAVWDDFSLEKVIVENVGTEGDFKKMTFLNMPIDREAYYDEVTKTVKLRERKVCDVDDLLLAISELGENGKGTEVNPAQFEPCDEGMTIDEDVDIDDLYIDLVGEKPDGSNSTMTFIGNTINITPWACVLVSSFCLKSDSNGGGITNSGRLTFADCVLKEGNYVVQNLEGGTITLKGNTTVGSGIIENSGSLYVEGTVLTVALTNKPGGCIYVTDALTNDMTVTIESPDDVEPGTYIIFGGNGYTLTTDDLAHLNIVLPSGYEWYYDEAQNAIVVNVVDNITELFNRKHSNEIYDLLGRKSTVHHKGVSIRRKDNSTVKKVIK